MNIWVVIMLLAWAVAIALQVGEEAERSDTGGEEHCYYHPASRSFVDGGYWGYAQQYHGL